MGMTIDNLVRFECDRCLKVRTFATMPTAGRPIDWHKFSDEFTENDPYGNALRGVTKRFLLCDECAPVTIPQRMPDENSVVLAKMYNATTESELADIAYSEIFADLKTLAGAVLSVDPATGDD